MPRSLMPLAAVLAVLSVFAFVAGAVMLGIGFSMDAQAGGGGGGGLFGGSNDPEKPGWNDGHPVGLYFMTRFWSGSGSLEKALYYFTSDGRVYVDLADGFSDETLAKHEGRHGTVRAEGDQLVFTWEDGKEQRGNLEKNSGSFTWDLGIFTPVAPFEDESPLVGRWEGGQSSSFGGSTAVTSNALDLAADGTFRGASAGSIRSESDESVVSGGGTADNAGRWELDGHSLVLTYGGGRTVRGIAFPYDDESTPVNPDRFYFAGIMYKKQ